MIAALTLQTVHRWRDRVELFHKAELRPPLPTQPGGKSRMRRMLNCSPAFAVCSPQTPFCGTPALCPFCHARESLLIWRRLDHRLFGAPQGSPVKPVGKAMKRVLTLDRDERPMLQTAWPKLKGFTLLDRELTVSMPFFHEKDGRQSCWLATWLAGRAAETSYHSTRKRRPPEALQNRKNDIRRMKEAGVLGGIESTHVARRFAKEPDPDFKGNFTTTSNGWLVSFRQLMLARREDADAIMRSPLLAPPTRLIAPITCEQKITQCVEPDRMKIMHSTADLLRFTRVPMTGSMKAVEIYANARYRRRLTATFGSFHGKRQS